MVESQRLLAQVLLDQGRLDEAERFALEARETVGAGDVSSSSTTRLALGLVRAAQGRDDEAERLLREAEEILRPTGFRRHQIAPLEALAEFLRAPRPRRRGGSRWRRRSRALVGEPAGTRSRPDGRAQAQARARIDLIAWLEASSGDSEITVAGRSNRSSASRSGSARSVPSP